MIRINRQTDYAVRVLLALARRPAGQRTSTPEIRREMLIPPVLAQRIVADLARGSFIVTYPGRDGGLVLARPPWEINLRQVVEHFEGRLFLSDCLTAGFNCPFDQKCPVRCHWVRLQSLLMHELEQINFAELAQEAQSVEGLATLGLTQKQVQRKGIRAAKKGVSQPVSG